MNKLVFVCAAAVMAASATTVSTSPVLAAPAQVVIDTAPFNLASQAGRSAVAQRIESAGDSVCGSYQGRDIRATLSFNACRDAAVADGMAQLNGLSRGASVIVGAR